MSWWYETLERQSEKNGRISGRRLLGRWTITTQRTQQTSPYVTGLWRRSLLLARPDTAGKKILLLGLGAGGALQPIRRVFPGSAVTAIEFDPVMVELSQRLHPCPRGTEPKIILGDAGRVIPQLTEQFDLILVDLFQGEKTPPALAAPAFWSALAARLLPTGIVILNAYLQPEVIARAAQFFTLKKKFRYYANALALLCPRVL